MLNDKNSLNHDNRNLSEVFAELQQIQYEQTIRTTSTDKKRKKKKDLKNTSISIEQPDNFDINVVDKKGIKFSNILIGCSVLLLATIAIFPKNVSIQESYAKEDSEEYADLTTTNFEINRKALNMQKIISENSSFEKVKEQVIEEREVEFETTTSATPLLPKGEEIVTQEGVNGKENVSLVKTYENGEFIEEIILGKETTLEAVPKLVDLGTSEFLAKLKVHIGDTIYLNKASTLVEEPESDSTEKAEIKQYLDVKLLDLPNEEWCKVSFDTIEGYLPTTALTSEFVTPNITEKNRIQKIKLKVHIDMELNKSSGLTLNDYKKIFTDLSDDTNNIFEDNAEVFYNIDKKYNINGVFLASMAIHESAWGTSQIAQDKNNLFGYGSYDDTPYESSFVFDDYAEGIETVAKSLVKYYLNPSGTNIYDGETASAWYYNGPTLKGVNTKYASDEDWSAKVYSYIEMLYNRL